MAENDIPPAPPQAPPPTPSPAAPSVSPAAPGWPPAGELTKDEKTMAMIAWLLGILTGIIGPLIIFLIKKDESKFVGFHSLQSLFFGLVVGVLFLAVLVFGFVTCGIGMVLLPLVWIGALVVNVLWCIKANNGEWAEMPVIGEWARR